MRAQVLLRRLQLQARLAIAEDVPTALALAQYSCPHKSQLPVESLLLFRSPFVSLEQKDPAQARKLQKTVNLLKRLGVKTIDTFLYLPATQITNRFGRAGLEICQNLQNAGGLPWPRFVPTETIIEHIDFAREIPIEGLEPILFYLKTLLERALFRLYVRGERLKSFRIILFQESLSTVREKEYGVDLALVLPHMAVKTILSFCRDKLEDRLRKEPMQARAEALRLLVLETAPVAAAQKDLFAPKKEEETEALHKLFSRLSVRLGAGSVFFAQARASYLPEEAWVRAKEPVTTLLKDCLPRRPLRILAEPIPVCAQDLNLTARLQREVVYSEWWRQHRERCYFRGITASGEHLWLFQMGEGLFLHGYFD